MQNRILIVITVAIYLLSSCSAGGTRAAMLNSTDDGRNTDNKLAQIVDAMNNRDKEALKALFSEQALEEAESLDDNIDYLFDFIQDDIESWERSGGPAIYEVVHYGQNTKESKTIYNVYTKENEYLLFLLEYTIDTAHAENVGLFMLQIIKAEDRNSYFDWGIDTRCAGVYRPDESDINVP